MDRGSLGCVYQENVQGNKGCLSSLEDNMSFYDSQDVQYLQERCLASRKLEFVYLFNCACGLTYVGRTTQRLEERVKQPVPLDLVASGTASSNGGVTRKPGKQAYDDDLAVYELNLLCFMVKGTSADRALSLEATQEV